MRPTVAYHPVPLPAPSHLDERADRINIATDKHHLFIAFGMRAGDPGYQQVVQAISNVGEVAHFNQGLLYLTTSQSIDQAFKRINKNIVDPRIPGDMALLIVDPRDARATWYLNRNVSDVMIRHWQERVNLFICHDDCSNKQFVRDVNALGQTVPISEHIWYVSTSYSPEEAFRILSGNTDKNGRLTIFDANGRIKSWQTELSKMRVHLATEDGDLPKHAVIHRPQSWQATMLAEFL